MRSFFRPRSPLPLLPTATISTTGALSDALKSFQDCLNPEQRAELEAVKAVPDAHAVAQFTHQLDQENAKRKSRCVAARISPLLESIQQFSGIVETFVSARPQIAALIWGSIKLVLQIASNFTTYFDKLSALLMTIGKRCPRFQEYQKLYGSSIDLQRALCDFYSMVVRCCEQAVNAIRRTGYIQLLKAMTGSFDSEFEPILVQIDRSSDEVSETIRLVEATLSTGERHDQRAERQEAQNHRLETIIHRKERMKVEADRMAHKQLERQKIHQASKLEQLSNFNNRIAYWKARTQRHGSTGQWLTRTDQFLQWIAGSSPSVLWFTGNLGSGKTVMTGYVVESLSAKYSQSTEKLVYFFCQYDNETSLQVTTILQSIIRQLLDQDGDTFTANEPSIDALLDNPHDLDSLERLIFDIVVKLKSVIVVLDGVDECSLTEMKMLLKTLRRLILRQPAGLKLYLAGDDRITDLIRSSLNPDFVVSTHVPDADSDLKELVQQLVDVRREDEDLVAGDSNLYREIVDGLCTASQGMILWVKFQLEELCSQKTDESIRLALRHLPKDIFGTYNRLLSRIAEEGGVETCNMIFWYLAVAKRPLTLDELGEALSVEPCQPWFMPDRLVNNTKGIVRWCHGLIALHDLDDTLQFAHSSVKDFFCSSETERVILQGFHFREEEANRRFGEVCITYLNFNDFKTQLVKASSPRPQAFLEPMMVADHALSTGSPGIVLDKVRDLMRKRSKSTAATSRLLLPQVIDRASQVATRDYQFLQYASEFWLSHTKEFSPDQGRMWTLFQTLAEQRYPALSGPRGSMLWYPDDRAEALRDYMFSHQHQALFRQWIAQNWDEDDFPLALALVLQWRCFCFVRLLPPLAEQPGCSWLEAVLSLNRFDLSHTLRDAGTGWIAELTLAERSELLSRVVGTNHVDFLPTSPALVQLGIDPYFECNNQGKITTLLEELISDPDVSLLRVVCGAMLASNADLERKIAHPGRNALHVAAELQKSEATTVLLEHGALVDAVDSNGQTALHIAVKGPGWTSYVFDPVLELLEAGAAQDIRDSDGKVALDYATGDVAHQLFVAIQNGPV